MSHVGGYAPDDEEIPDPYRSGPTQNVNVAPSLAKMAISPPVGFGGIRSSSMMSNPTGSPIDWNGLFQRLLDSPDDTQELRLKKYEDISTLNNNFVAMAKQLGKMIIAERFLDDRVKTIKPQPLNGIAGGPKYLYNGILFKLQTDWKQIYGGDHNAMKSGSLELKGLMRYYGFPKIHVPLIAVIDFRGYRLVAESHLPIGNDTLKYGTADAGKTVYDASDCLELQDLMRTVGTSLNLAGHWCGLDPANQKYLYGPIDVEGHKGRDGRFYVIDLARVFPPTAEPDGNVATTFLYQSFRPEFVRRHHAALSSDAFSAFSRNSPDAAEHNERVRQATAYLLDSVVPEFAVWLENNANAISTEHPLVDITELAHREGINVRYLGLVRSRLTTPTLRNYVLMELIARVIKNTINAQLREAASATQGRTRGSENFFPIVLELFNIILGDGIASDDWWRATIKRELSRVYKPTTLNREESHPTFSLRPLVDFYALFRRVQQLTGIRLTKIVMTQLKTSKTFELVSPDIIKIGVRTKHMNITSQAQGSALAIKAMASMSSRIEESKNTSSIRRLLEANGADGDSEAKRDRSAGYDRLFQLSMMKFEQAIRATPDNKAMLTHYASVLIRVALLKTNLNEPSATFFEKAMQKLRICGDTMALMQLGELLLYLKGYWNETDALLRIACDCFQAVTDFNPMYSLAWCCWADCLVARARASRQHSYYKEAGSRYRHAVKLSPLAGCEWLSSCMHSLSDEELAAAIELLGRKKRRRCDSDVPIRESTVTNDHEKKEQSEEDKQDYRELVEAVSSTIDSVPGALEIADPAAELSISTSVILASPSPSLTRDSSSIIGMLSPPLASGALSPRTNTTGTSTPPASNSCVNDLCSPHPNASSTGVNTLDASLVFDRSYVGPALLNPLASSIPSLKALRLAHCNPLPQSLNILCPTLTELNVSGCTDATDLWVASVVTIPGLARLDISYCPKLSYLSLKDVMTKCNSLSHFYASHSGAVKEPKLDPQLGFASHQLQILHLAGFRISAESWCRLISHSHLHSLRKLVLDDCFDVNDAVLSALGQRCPLTHVSLRGCASITNQGIEALLSHHQRHKPNSPASSGTTSPAHHPKPLRYIDLTDCHSITTHALDALGTHLTSLESVILNNVPLFENQTNWLGVPLTSSDASVGRSLTSSAGNSNSMDSPDSLRGSTERGKTPAPFKKLVANNPSLCRLELANTGVSDTHLSLIPDSTNAITQLKLVSGAITDAGLLVLAKSSLAIQLLDLEGATVTDVGLRKIAKAFEQTLTALSLNNCTDSGLTEAGLISIAYHCSQLTQLDLSHSTCVSDKSITAIAEKCPQLQRLSLVGGRFLTDDAVEALARHSHNLQYLNLSRCPCIISLGPLGEGCPQLRELRARGCEFVSDDTPGFGRLANLRALRYLDLRGCHYITDITLGMLETDACPDLQVLVLGRNKTRDVHVQSLRQARRTLNIQNLSDQTLGTPVVPRSTSMNNSGSVLSESIEISSPMHNPHHNQHHQGVGSGGTYSMPSNAYPHLGTHSASRPTGSSVSHLRTVVPTPTSGQASSSVATKTLMNDLKAIQKNPVPYVSAEPVDESNLYVWHGNLLGPQNTPYAGAIFHIELTFPSDYPTNPPSATLFTPLPHPHVHKDHICLDILSDYKGYFSAIQELEGKDTREMSGWHPSYTVQSILLSMQSFLMDMKENAHGAELRELMVKIPDSIKTAATFSCPKCPHSPSNPFPHIAAEVPNISLSEKQIIADELRCVHTRTPWTEDTLGICVEVADRRQNGEIMNLRYHMNLLSHKAFEEGIRTAEKADKLVFLPFWIDEQHGVKAMPLAEKAIAQLSTGNVDAIFISSMAVDVLTQLMKVMVVDLVKSGASINLLQYYFAAHRLLIAFVKKYPELLTLADKTVTQFVESPQQRLKRKCPDLGCLLMLLTITSSIGWREVAQAYMQESSVRNVSRAIEKAPELGTPKADPRVDVMRTEKTFLLTITSLRIAMLQKLILEHIGKPQGVTLDEIAAKYDSLYGRLPVSVREDLLAGIKGIMTINTWADTFKFLGLPSRSNEEVGAWLRDCVQAALKAGYWRLPRTANSSTDIFSSPGPSAKERERMEKTERSGYRGLERAPSDQLSRVNRSNSGRGSLHRSGSARLTSTPRSGDASPSPTASPASSTHSYHSHQGYGRQGRQHQYTKSNEGTPTKRRSRGSSNASSTSVGTGDEYDVVEFDFSLEPSSAPRGSVAASPSKPRAWTGNPNLAILRPDGNSHAASSSANASSPQMASGPSSPASSPRVAGGPPAIFVDDANLASPPTTLLPPSPQSSYNIDDGPDSEWIPTGKPRKKAKQEAPSAPVYSQGRGIGRGSPRNNRQNLSNASRSNPTASSSNTGSSRHQQPPQYQRDR